MADNRGMLLHRPRLEVWALIGLLASAACASLPGPGATGTAAPAARATAVPAAVLATPMPTPPPMTVLPTPTPVMPPAGQAIYEGTVFIDGTNTPIPSAKVELAPFGVSALTDSNGRFWFDGLPINGRCRWATITVSAPGYGRLRRIDEPFLPSHLTATLFLGTSDSERYVGPPLAAFSPGPDYCAR